MLLYHGSNIVVTEPRLLTPSRPMDFGSGFYLTSDLEQARRWANRTVKRHHDGTPAISVFEVDLPLPTELQVLRLDTPDEHWFDFVIGNRTVANFPNAYDIVIGPIANDQTILTFDLFMGGILTKEAAIAELMPQRLAGQYTFRTPAALSLLKFKEVIHG